MGESVTEPPDVVEGVPFGATAVDDGLAPRVALADEPGVVLVPDADVDPDVPELPGLAGVVPAGFGLATGGLLDELDDGLGLGDGFGVLAVAAGGALLGAAPAPNANPTTVPGAGS